MPWNFYKRQIGLLLKPELADPTPDDMFPEAKLAPNLLDWLVEHANRYLASGDHHRRPRWIVNGGQGGG